MRFEGLDLNLLVAFNIFLEEKSVSKAAEKLQLSQPATSAALARLREYFDDPILVQHGHRMYATTHATMLLPHVKQLLSTARTITSIPSAFSPQDTQRTFRIGASIFALTTLVGDIFTKLTMTSPGVHFSFGCPESNPALQLESGELELLVGSPNIENQALYFEPFYEDDFVLVGCKKNPIFNKKVTTSSLQKSQFIAVSGMYSSIDSWRSWLDTVIPSRQTHTEVPSYLVVPWFIANTPLLCMMPKRLAHKLCENFDLKISELPHASPKLSIGATLHRTRREDAGLNWLIQQLKAQSERNEAEREWPKQVLKI